MDQVTDSVTRIGANGAKNRLSELLRRVEQGDSFVITRRGRAVARLVPPEEADSRLDLETLRASMSRTRSRIAGTLDVLELVREGRRRSLPRARLRLEAGLATLDERLAEAAAAAGIRGWAG